MQTLPDGPPRQLACELRRVSQHLCSHRASPPPARPAERSTPPSPPAVGKAFPKAPLPVPRPMGTRNWDRTAVGRRSFGSWHLMRRPVASKAFRPEGGVEARTDAASAESLSAHDVVQHVSSADTGVMQPVASLRMGRRASGATGPGEWNLSAVSQELRSWTGLGRGRLTRQGAVVEGEVAQLHGLHRGDVRNSSRPFYVPRLVRVRDNRRR